MEVPQRPLSWYILIYQCPCHIDYCTFWVSRLSWIRPIVLHFKYIGIYVPFFPQWVIIKEKKLEFHLSIYVPTYLSSIHPFIPHSFTCLSTPLHNNYPQFSDYHRKWSWGSFNLFLNLSIIYNKDFIYLYEHKTGNRDPMAWVVEHMSDALIYFRQYKVNLGTLSHLHRDR